jgi:hypothetical protein
MQPEPHRVAARLGFDETTIDRLAARGHLRRLALTDSQIRGRLYQAHFNSALARPAKSRSVPNAAASVGDRKPLSFQQTQAFPETL